MRAKFVCIFVALCFALSQASYPRTFPSMFLSNWESAVISWSGSRLNPNSGPIQAPGVVGVRRSVDWNVNLIKEDSFALFVDSTPYTTPDNFDGQAWLQETGEFVHDITLYNAEKMPFSLRRGLIFPPSEDFYLVQYVLNNTSPSAHKVTLLDYFVSEIGISNQNEDAWGWLDADTGLLSIDLGKQNPQETFFSSCQPKNEMRPTSFEIGMDGDSTAPLRMFQEKSGALVNLTQAHGSRISIGRAFDLTLNSGDHRVITVARMWASEWSSIARIAKQVSAKTATQHMSAAQASVRGWLSHGAAAPSLLSAAGRRLYTTSLLAMKHSQNPTLGTFVASFHPAYGYKVWGRDAVFSAMIMDAAGYPAEAELFLHWFAQAQPRGDGLMHTCYSHWDGTPVSFVEPQLDSLGAYPMAVLMHCHLHPSRCSKLLTASVKGRLSSIASTFMNYKDARGYGFAPPDYSIWEESSDPLTGRALPVSFFTFSQAMSYAGLQAIAELTSAHSSGLSQYSPDQLKSRSEEIKSAILAHLWMDDAGHFARGMWSDSFTLDERVESSSVAMIYTGMLDSEPAKAKSHLQNVQTKLATPGGGISRYQQDPFFYDSIYNPGGQEVGAPAPPWGVVTMFTAWAELYQHDSSNIGTRLNWMISHASKDSAGNPVMPVGEAVDGVSGDFVMSSCPDLYEYAGVYIWTSLMAAGKAPIPNPNVLSL